MTQSTFAIAVSVVGVIQTFCSIYISVIDKEEKNKRDKLIKKMFILVGIITLISGVFLFTYEFEPEPFDEMPEERLIKKAEEYFLINDYSKVYEVYKTNKLDTNPLALTNLGYMYENGLGVEVDIDIARKYYYNASLLGDETNINNWIIFVLKYPKSYEEVLSCLDIGCKINSEISSKFIKNIMPDLEEYDYCDLFINLPYERQLEILQMSTYEESYTEEKNYDSNFIKEDYLNPAYIGETIVTGVYKKNQGDVESSYEMLLITRKAINKINYLTITRFAFIDDQETSFIFNK